MAKQEEQAAAATEQNSAPAEDEGWRKRPEVQRAWAEIKELRDRLSKRDEDEKAAKAKAEREALESKGQYDAVKAQLEKDLAESKAAHAREVTALRIEAELARAGLTNTLAIRGAVASYDGKTEIAEYVAAVQKENAALFAKPGIAGSGTPPQGAASGAPREDDIASLQAQLRDRDPKVSKAAAQKLEAYVLKHGAPPPPR